MFGVLAKYLAVAGAIAGAAQVGRGVTRGATRLLHGDPRGALAEVAGGLAAPAVAAASQVVLLGQEVCCSVIELTMGVSKEDGLADSPWVPPTPSHRRGVTAPAGTSNGAA